MKGRAAWAVLIGLLSLMPLARAETVGFWDFNNPGDFLGRTAGTSGSMAVALYDASVLVPSYIGSGPGTTVNSGGYPAGDSLKFGDFASIAGVGYVTLTGLDFAGLSQPTFSFAWKKNDFVTFFESFAVEYNTGSGWQHAVDLGEPGTSYTAASYTFAPGVLDNKSNVGIRLHFVEVVDVASFLDVDNVTVSAVPEPAAVGLLGLGGIGLLAARRRRE